MFEAEKLAAKVHTSQKDGKVTVNLQEWAKELGTEPGTIFQELTVKGGMYRINNSDAPVNSDDGTLIFTMEK